MLLRMYELGRAMNYVRSYSLTRSLHFEQQQQERQQKMHDNIELDLLCAFFSIHSAWSWINHDLSMEMKEIWLVCFFYYYYSVSFIRFQLLAEFCCCCCHSTHITNAFTHHLDPRSFNFTYVFRFLIGGSEKNMENLTILKMAFMPAKWRKNHHHEYTIIWFKVSIMIWKKWEFKCLCANVYFCVCVFVRFLVQRVYALTNRLKCKTYKFRFVSH